jgi:nitroreductase
MEKIAETNHPVMDLIRKRWSGRAFSEKPVEHAVLRSLLEAARWAPSSSNEQPWIYLLATRETPAEFERMLGCVNENNRKWAALAPVLMLAVARMNSEKSGQPNRHAFYDLGQATAQLALEATSRGLMVHQMAGILPQKAREIYGVPPDYEVVTGIAVGYPGDPERLPEQFKEREVAARSPRKPLGAFVFNGKWGEPSPIVK